MKKIFEFKKQRTIDQIIEGAFQFFRTHIKNILKILWQYNSILIVGLMASYFFYNYYYFGMFNNMLAVGENGSNFSSDAYSAKFVMVAFSLFVFSFFFFPRFFATVLGYIRVYIENEGEVIPEKVNIYIKEKFWGLIGLTILIVFAVFIIVLLLALLTFLGRVGVFFIIFLSIPALFYISVFLSLIYYVYFFEDLGVIESFSRTKQYIKQRFWFSFWVIFVLGFIVAIIGMVFNAPIIIYGMIKGIMLAEKSGISEYAQQGDLFVSLISVLSYIGQMILKILNIIGIALLYFSLREYHTQENLIDKIDQIGQTETYDN